MVDLFKLRDQLDEDWKPFEAYVEQNENHENPDPRDIPWPNNMFWKTYILSEAWRVLQNQKEYRELLEVNDLAFPLANMIVVDYVQFPNSNQRVELQIGYELLCKVFSLDPEYDFISFGDMLDVMPAADENWIGWMKARCRAYQNDPHKSMITSEQVWEVWGE